ncbi:MAG: response regulator [Candidatus Methylomirabilis sp.]|nr:response regulator [Deltaproteobacteria bacterium]
MADKKVLVADDHYHITRPLAFMLRREGYEPLIARDGVEAVEILEREAPGVVILDLNMPRMDGWQLFERVSAEPERFARTAIIILSASAQDEDVERGLRLGARDFLLKPFDPDEVLAKIARCFEERAA